jgi:hypothetical protein
VRNKFTMWMDTMTQYDKQGLMTKQVVNVKMDPTIYYNSENLDHFLESPAENQTMTFVYNEDGSASGNMRGLICKVVVPGYGPVYMETGHTSFHLTVGGTFETILNSGHNQAIDGDVTALCNFLK